MLKCEFALEDSVYFWHGVPASDYPIKDGKIIIPFTLKLADYNGPVKNVKLKIYLWNEGKNKFLLEKITFNRRKPNPILYALFADF
jgi:hypothetical protein